MANLISNHFKYQLAAKQIHLGTDTMKMRLVVASFAFDIDTHAVIGDVSASSWLGYGNGYSAPASLSSASLAEDDTNDRAQVTWADVTWTASPSSIGPTAGAIIWDSTATDSTIMGYVDFSGNQTITTGNSLKVENLATRIT